MAKTAQRRASWQRPGSPIGHKGPRKAHPRYKRNLRKNWTAADMRMLARQNTPTRVIGLKLGRTAIAVRGKAQREGISLKPVNRSPYNRRRTRRRS
jgi:hypothetical protein